MIEIIVAVILQMTTILGGGDADKDQTQQQEKSKTENTKDSLGNTAEGGAGTWDG